jgi:hypothetical protein
VGRDKNPIIREDINVTPHSIISVVEKLIVRNNAPSKRGPKLAAFQAIKTSNPQNSPLIVVNTMNGESLFMEKCSNF